MDEEQATVEGEEQVEETQVEEPVETPEESPEETPEVVTDKGTKLDPNPESAVNQLRANAEAKLKEYETFLNNPEAVENYLKQLKGTQENKGEELTPDKIESTEDLQKFLKQEREKDKKELEKIQKQLSHTSSMNQFDSDLTSVRKQWPDLTAAQENAIGDLFEKVNLNEKGEFEPKMRLMEIAKSVMAAAEDGKKQGSKQAQTIVRNAKAGRTISGTVTDAGADESKMSASELIAHRMKQAIRKRG